MASLRGSNRPIRSNKSITDPAEHRARLDPVARMFAQSVQHHLLPPRTPNRPALTGKPPEIADITGEAVNATVTIVRAVLTDGTVRQFTFRMTENVTEERTHTPMSDIPDPEIDNPPGEPQSVRDAYDRLADKSGANRDRADEARWTPDNK